jgi:exosortase E/protease (VPEID-CTERM system)
MLWAPTAGVTFQAVAYVLRGWVPNLHTDAATRLLRADHFAVLVADDCSGLEGIGLILAFLVCWLVYFRSEYRFPRALLLIPLGVALIFALNIVRIAVLMLIGNAGYADVAIYGFHSQAGWISFIAVACGMAFVSRESPWLNREAHPGRKPSTREVNQTAVYLLPLLCILAAGLISHALSGKFESFYPLRLAASVAALWLLRRHLKIMDWRSSWRRAFIVGAAVFLLWWISARILLPPTPMPGAFAAWPTWGQWGWLACRVLGAVATVPLAEELAYRGYLMRRLQGAEFDHVAYSRVGWPALAASSVVFGMMHGSMWIPGVIAGLAYGLLARRSGTLGESVLAHATTNALIAACVLSFGDWRLW